MERGNVRLMSYLDVLARNGPQSQKWFCVLYAASEGSVARLERFLTEDDFRAGNSIRKTWYCEMIQQVVSRKVDDRHAFQFEYDTASSPFTFACTSLAEQENWLTALNDVIEEEKRKRSAMQSTGSKQTVPSSNDPIYENESWLKESKSTTDRVYENVSQDQEKTLYQSLDSCTRTTEETVYQPLFVGSLPTYDVQVLETNASKRCNLTGSYKLQITSKNLTLLSSEAKEAILVWPYKYIRRFGSNSDSFTFEAGRRCESGEGLFVFTTSLGKEMVVKVKQARDSAQD